MVRKEANQEDAWDDAYDVEEVVVKGQFCGFEGQAESIEVNWRDNEVDEDADSEGDREPGNELARQILQTPVRVEDEQTCCEISQVEHAGIQGHLVEQLHNKHPVNFLLFIFSTNINYLADDHAY